LRKELTRVAANEVLIASCLSENSTGGDPGRSSCYIDPVEGGYVIAKQSPAISYGSIADAIMVSARRGADAEPHEQVLAYCTAPAMDVVEAGVWDSLGMRGTGSSPFSLTARVTAGHVFDEPFAVVGAQTMIPASHVLWAAGWLGIAREAVKKTLAYLRTSSDRGTPLETSRDLKLARARRLISEMTVELDIACARVQNAEPGLVALRTTYFNSLKLKSSESLIEIVTLCLQLVGITGYLNSGPHSLARLLRDSHSAPLMVSNQRIELNNARGARMPLEAV
jgi:acyl-CoA dehydrogenase